MAGAALGVGAVLEQPERQLDLAVLDAPVEQRVAVRVGGVEIVAAGGQTPERIEVELLAVVHGGQIAIRGGGRNGPGIRRARDRDQHADDATEQHHRPMIRRPGSNDLGQFPDRAPHPEERERAPIAAR